MLISPHIQTFFELNYNLEGKNEKILVIKCQDCPESNKNFYDHHKCICCFFKTLKKHKTDKFSFISFEKFNDLIESENITPFIKYLKKLNKIKNTIQNIQKIKDKNCKFKGFKCKFFPNKDFYDVISKGLYYNPILFYNNLQAKLDFINEKKNELDPVCKNCIEDINDEIIKLIRLLDGFELFKEYISFQRNSFTTRKPFEFYEMILKNNYQWLKNDEALGDEDLKEIGQKIDLY
ncbi:MAG: hypothetical protein ACFFAO_18550, partial [Candidatus Hermodarchaeota archaeon]